MVSVWDSSALYSALDGDRWCQTVHTRDHKKLLCFISVWNNMAILKICEVTPQSPKSSRVQLSFFYFPEGSNHIFLEAKERGHVLGLQGAIVTVSDRWAACPVHLFDCRALTSARPFMPWAVVLHSGQTRPLDDPLSHGEANPASTVTAKELDIKWWMKSFLGATSSAVTFVICDSRPWTPFDFIWFVRAGLKPEDVGQI